jgi:predicted RNase H-like HicB family nuclease
MGAYMKQVYPTFIVNIEDNPVHPFLVCVPDLDILTEGDSLFNAIEMARDAIGVAGITLEDRNTEIPTPSEQDVAIEKVMKYSDEVDFSKGILTYVDIDFIEYRRKIDLENPTADKYDWGKPVGAEFGAVNLIEEESVNNQKNDDGAKELYNLIIKMEREEVSAEKIIETIKLMGEK